MFIRRSVYEALVEKCNLLESENKDAKVRYADALTKVNQLEPKVKDLTTINSSLANTIQINASQMGNLRSSNEVLVSKIDKLVDQNATLLNANSKLDDANTKLKTDIKALKADLEKMTALQSKLYFHNGRKFVKLQLEG